MFLSLPYPQRFSLVVPPALVLFDPLDHIPELQLLSRNDVIVCMDGMGCQFLLKHCCVQMSCSKLVLTGF